MREKILPSDRVPRFPTSNKYPGTSGFFKKPIKERAITLGVIIITNLSDNEKERK